MKLVMIGGASAPRLANLIRSSADNVDITIHNNLYSFIEAASMRATPVDRLFLLEDALRDLEGDRKSQLESFARFLEGNYPQIRAFFMAKSEDILRDFANVFNAYNYLTLSIQKINAQFVQDVALQPIDTLATRYSASVVKADAASVISNSAAPAEKPKPQAAQEPPKKEKKGLFGRRKPANNVGNSPTAPLSPSQSSGFGFNTQNPSGSSNSENGFNTFGNAQNNGFGQPETGNTNPFAQQSGNTNPFAQQEAGNTNPFGNQASNTNPFAQQEADNTNPFENQASNANPFGQPETDNTNPFESPTTQGTQNTDPFGAPHDDTPFENTPSELNPFNVSSFKHQSEAIEEIDEIEPGLNASPFGSPQGFAGGNAFSPSTENPTQNPMNFGVDDTQTQPRQNARQPQNPVQNTPNFGGDNPFGGQAGVPGVEQNPRSFDGSEQNYGQNLTPDFSQNQTDLDSQMGFTNNPYTQQQAPLDMSRLQSKGSRSQYDFKSAQAVHINRNQGTRQNLEEASAISTAPVAGMMIDDSAYQQQFAPAPRVVEKIVEREVYIDSGTETPAQKLLDAGKQVVIVVTGDRRSGVTYSAMTLAALYGKRYSTLLVDLDSETCGGQLYQDIEVLIGEDENVQHGVKRAKNPTLLGNLVHHDTDDNYDYLFSMLGNEPITDLEIRNLCSALNAQRQFQLVIIDCPWKRINCLDEILMSAKVMLCVDADVSGCYNIVRLLGEQAVGSRVTTAIERAGGYIAKFGTSTQNLMQNMAWIHETFNDDSQIDWTSLRVLGTSDKQGLLEAMKKL